MLLHSHQRVSAAYKTLLSLFGWVSIVATTGFFDGRVSWSSLEMFTTQSNILCALYFTVAAVRLWLGHDRTSIPFAPAWKGIATMAVTITFLVAWLVLHMPISFESAAGASLLGLHVVVPLMAIVDWFIFDPVGRLSWRDPLIWLIAPAAYLVEFVVVIASGGSLGGGTGAVGEMAGGGFGQASRAPYPFLDFDSLGVPAVVLNVSALAVGVVAIGFAAVAIDHWRGRRTDAVRH